MNINQFFTTLALGIKENVFSLVNSTFTEFVVVASLIFGVIFIIGLFTDGKYFQK